MSVCVSGRLGTGFVVACVTFMAGLCGIATPAPVWADYEPFATSDSPPVHDATTGTLPGVAGVSGGAATYSIPIEVPPGRAGMQPSLSLTYSSRSGNGIAGVGWSLAGLSVIHRCPQTPEQDAGGRAVGVSYTTQDRLCLDGQRLVRVSGGLYGQANAVYKTEIDSYARITQVGGDIQTGTTCFRVEERSGHVLHYGAVVGGERVPAANCGSAVNGRAVPEGKSQPLSWLLVKVEDRTGNNQIIKYATYGPGEYLPSTILYTGENNTEGNRSVIFEYEGRTTNPVIARDATYTYLAGGLSSQTQRLKKITTKAGASTARVYKLGYEVSGHSGRLLLNQVQLCGTDGTTCHPATEFEFNQGENDYRPRSLIDAGMPTPVADAEIRSLVSIIGDLDGDGTREVAASVPSEANEYAHLFLLKMTADRQLEDAIDLTGTQFRFGANSYVDIDGDGRAELIRSPTSSAQSGLSLGTWKLPRGQAAGLTVPKGTPPAQAMSALFTSVTTNIPLQFGVDGPVYPADLDGNGKNDLLLVRPDSSCDASGHPGSGRGLFPYLNTVSGALSGSIAFTAHARLFCLTPTYTSGLPNTPIVSQVSDFDGNGLPDFHISLADGEHAGKFIGIRLTQSVAGSLTSTLTTPLTCSTDGNVDECGWDAGFAVKWMDVNGDGLQDFVFARPSQGTWRVRLNSGGGALAAAIDTGSSDGLQKATLSSFRYAGGLPSMDFDSDGTSEILVPSVKQGFALRMCQIARVPPVLIEPGTLRCPNAYGTNINESSTIPVANQCPAWACSPSLDVLNPNLPPDGEPGGIDPFPAAWGNLPAYDAYHQTSDHPSIGDISVYHFAALKFRMDAANAISTHLVETDIVSTLRNVGLIAPGEDLFGDGLADLVTNVGCPEKQNAFHMGDIDNDGDPDILYYPNCSAIDDGTYGPEDFVDGTPAADFVSNPVLFANVNYGAGPSTPLDVPQDLEPDYEFESSALLPDFLSGVTNGLGRTAHWAYAPMGYPMSQGQIPLYDIDSETDSGYADNRHYYFTSSMPVVTAMTQDNGIGGETGSESVVFGYEMAMYHHFGRGFQGFLGIHSMSASTDTDRRVLTTARYHQRFPLAGRISSVTKAANGTVFERQTNTWVCGTDRSACPQSSSSKNPPPAAPEVSYAPVLDSSLVKRYDLADGADVASIETSNVRVDDTSGWDAYGNLWRQVVTSKDLGSDAFVSNHTIATTNEFTTDTTDWWVDKLDNRTVTATSVYSTPAPEGNVPARTVTTEYVWHGDRTLDIKTIQSGVAQQELITDYGYPTPSHGLPNVIEVSGSDVLPTERSTNFTYTTDGYFVATETNPEGHTTSTTTSTLDGQVTAVIDPAGLKTSHVYDELGHLKTTTYLGTDHSTTILPTSYYSFAQCASGLCDKVAYDQAAPEEAASRVVNVQVGRPTNVRWFDRLGREIKTAHRGFDGDFIASETSYDEMGAVAETTAPFEVESDPETEVEVYLTGWDYDALGRATEKLEHRDPTQGNIQTTYTYSGNKTSIEVKKYGLSSCSGTNLCMVMSRSHDVLGRLAKTTQSKGGNASYATTSYWYDGMGNPIAVRDAENNVLGASYNDVGHRTSVRDPDAGTSTFTYNALGEMLTRTDARSVATAFEYDGIGRLTERTATDSAAADASLRVIRDEWDYDQALEDGLLHQVTRSTGSTVANLSALWTESYAYDALSKRLSTISTEASGQSRDTAMTYVQGHERTVTYPSGLVVGKSYTATGELDQLYNAATNETYWQATGKDAWSNVVAEEYGSAVTGSHESFAATGQMESKSWIFEGAAFDEWDYKYDVLGNVTEQKRSVEGATPTVETYIYDELQRLTSASRTGVPGAPGSVSYDYSPSGNIRSKTDFSTTGANAYQYGAGACGPHAANAVSRSGGGSTTYTCDASGNVIGGSTLTASYDFNNQPWKISRVGGGEANFAYTSNGDLFRQETTTRTTYFGPRGYEKSGSTERHLLGPVIVLRENGADTVRAALRDRLGSQVMLAEVDAIVSPFAPPVLSVDSPESVDGNFTLTWTSVPNASRYVLKQRINAEEDWEIVFDGLANTWSPSPAKTMGRYIYQVQACDADCGDNSEEVSVDVAPPRPATLSANPKPSPNGTYDVKWDTVNGAQRYELEEWAPGEPDWENVATMGATPDPWHTWHTEGRSAGTYQYRVRACLIACSTWRVMDPAQQVNSTTVPLPPAWINVNPLISTNGSYVVTWDQSSGTTFVLEYGYGSAPTHWQAFNGLTSATKSFQNQSNGQYTYRAKACNDHGCSGVAPNVTATVRVEIPAPPGIPLDLEANPWPSLDGTFDLSWGPVSGTGIEYRVERRLNGSSTWGQIAVQSGALLHLENQPDGYPQYRVRACKDGLCGNYSDIYYMTVEYTPPIPEWITATPTGTAGEFDVAWASSPQAGWYTLLEKTDNGAWHSLHVEGNGTLTSYRYQRGNGTYQYQVKACRYLNGNGRCSDFTPVPAQIQVQGSGVPNTPASISAPSFCPTRPCTFTVEWSSVSNAQTYELHEWAPEAGIDREPVAVVNHPTRAKTLQRNTVGGLSQVLYMYEVRACTGTGASKVCSPYRERADVLVGPNRSSPVVSGATTSYDAFGQARNGDFSDRPNGILDLMPETERGFTDHLHADDVWLIHMNGRVYDYQLGRFLSVDPIIQFPSNSQSLNPYSYILNNPLSGVDPTGYQAKPVPYDSRSICAKSWSSCSNGSVKAIGSLSGFNQQSETATSGSGSSNGRAQQSSSVVSIDAASETSISRANASKAGEELLTNSVDTVVVRPDQTWIRADEVTWNLYGAEKVDWLASVAHASGYNMISGFYKFQWELFLSQFSGDAPGVGIAGGAGVLRGANIGRTVGADAKFAQGTYSQMFSAEGIFAGSSVEDVAAALRAGSMQAAEVPINYIVRNGQTIILNTRSAQALEAAGIPRSQWNGVNQTGNQVFENLLNDQLRRNPGAPFDVVRPSGGR